MTKRRFESRIPGESIITLRFLEEQLHAVVDTLSEREAGVIAMTFGLIDSVPRSIAEIAAVYRVRPKMIKEIQSRAMSKLRYPTRSHVLRDYLDSDDLPVLAQTRFRRLAEQGLVQCPRHGWLEMPSSETGTCPCCPCPLKGPGPRGGRPQEYCTPACRQMGFRRRRAAASAP